MPNDPSHVTVPAGEVIAVRGMLTSFASITSVQWLKNGQPIPDQQGLIIQLGFISATDAGAYRAQLTLSDGRTQLSQALRLSVVTTGADLSVLSFLGAGISAGRFGECLPPLCRSKPTPSRYALIDPQ